MTERVRLAPGWYLRWRIFEAGCTKCAGSRVLWSGPKAWFDALWHECSAEHSVWVSSRAEIVRYRVNGQT